ncbi:MAG: VOC family protein [Planctomycetota bacterium]|nr:VOC family protein [Planctomycetota bacterium]
MIGNMARIILFVKDMPKVTAFYRDTLGLRPIESKSYSPDEWIEFEAGGCNIALHKASKPGGRTRNKFVFYSADPMKVREELIAAGVKMFKPMVFGSLVLCDGEDPEGNKFQISTRVT